MKLFAMTFGSPTTGSTLYRLVQYQPFLKEKGIDLEIVSKAQFGPQWFEKLQEADVVINQKCLFSLPLQKKIRKMSKKLIFDFDDAIYTRPGTPYSWITQWRVGRRLNYWLAQADCVIAANHHLGWYAKLRGCEPKIIPMALDLKQWKPKEREKSDSIIMGWAGAPCNLHYVERLEPVLKIAMRQNPNLKLKVFSGKKPVLDLPYEYVPFQIGYEPQFVASLDIGLLPLVNDPFTQGKSPIKAMQYLACEVPVIGNVVGATAEILNGCNSIPVDVRQEWLDGIDLLANREDLRQEMGKKGRQTIEKHYNVESVKNKIYQIVEELG
ncbi:MAG: glycosyltransferase family 4 protein [Chlamydiales bacterium]